MGCGASSTTPSSEGAGADQWSARRALTQLQDVYSVDTDKLKSVFVSLDKNADGRITGDEFAAAVMMSADLNLTDNFKGTTAAELAEMFKLLDVDGSGALSWQEFENGIKSNAREEFCAPPQAPALPA